MAKTISYLKQLRFDPKLATSLIAKYLHNQRLVLLLVLSILLIGITSFLSIPKVLNPSIKIPIVIVSTALPGASPKDVESLVTIPVEDSLGSLTSVDTITSTSQNSVSIVTVQFTSGVNPDKAQTDVQNAVSTVSTLPKDAKAPKVQKLDFENQPVWTFSVSSTSDSASLMRFGTILQKRLKDLSTVDRVTTTGLEEQEIQVVLKPEAIATYGLNPQILGQAITSATGSFPAGSVVTGNSSFALTIDPSITSVNDLRNLRINLGGTKNVELSSVAAIAERVKPDQGASYLGTKTTKANRSIRFDVYKTSTTSVQQAVTDAKAETNRFVDQYQGTFVVNSLLDSQFEIDRQFNELVRDLAITVGLVFLVLFIFLGIRQAIVASLAIPLTFLITFTIMRLTGIDLSFIAFFSLLLSLGLLVDDTVVVISAMTAYFRSGKFTPVQTGLLVWRDFITAIFTTTITTVWAFLPLLLASGIIGEFIKPIPIVVSSTLLASFAVAMLITMPFIIFLLKPFLPNRVKILFRILLVVVIIGVSILILPKNNIFILELLALIILYTITFTVRRELFDALRNKFTKKKIRRVRPARAVVASKKHSYLNEGIISFEHIAGNSYRRLLNIILSSQSNRRKTIIMVVIFWLFAILLLPLGFVKNEFFPKSDAEQLYVNVELPAGTNSSVANTEALRLLEDLRHTPEIKYVTADIGFGFSSSGNGFGSQGANNILFTVVLPQKSMRHSSSIDIADNLRNKYQNYQKGTLQVIEESGGPPAGSDVQIKLSGDDLSILDSYADKLVTFLQKQQGVINVDKSIKPGTGKLVFVPDVQKIADAGIPREQIGFWLRTYASGFTADTIRLDTEGATLTNDITIRTSNGDADASSLDAIGIPTPSGTVVPLSSLGKVILQSNPTIITRENGKRTLSVTAGIAKGASASDANQKLLQYAKTLSLPEGYSYSTGGVNEENQKSVTSILQAMLLSFLLITITMVLQFGSFRRAFIVMLVIPLSIAGVFIIFSLTHTPLSFPALIGVLALFGIVVKNSILIVDKIVHNLAAGIEYKYAIIDAAESRLEPIALTSFTAIIGLIPITLSNALWQGLGGAIISGLVFSGTIMLFFIPVVYYIMFKPKVVVNNRIRE